MTRPTEQESTPQFFGKPEERARLLPRKIETADFWRRAERRGDCLIWTGPINSTGYGRYWVGSDYFLAHRIAYMLGHGKDPAGFMVCHTCDNPRCIEPRHLFAGTGVENTADMKRKGRAQTKPRPGSTNPRAKITEMDVINIKRMIAAGVSNTQIAQSFPVGHALISRIRTGRSWQHV
jgi:hypothetical protein